MNTLLDPARRMVKVLTFCAIFSFCTIYILPTYKCKIVEEMPEFNLSIRHDPYEMRPAEYVDKKVPGVLFLHLLCTCLPFLVWALIGEERLHIDQRINEARKWGLLGAILILVWVLTMLGIGELSSPTSSRPLLNCFTWGFDVVMSVCYDRDSMPDMLHSKLEVYFTDTDIVYKRCTFFANQRNNLILFALYWYLIAEMAFYIVGALRRAIQSTCGVEGVRTDEEPTNIFGHDLIVFSPEI